MTENEAMHWALDHNKECSSYLEFDECGNERRVSIFQICGELFMMRFINSSPEHSGENAAGEKIYDPVKVMKKTRMIEQIVYVDESGHEKFTRLSDFYD
jgi:hypothetical protein